MYPKTYLKSYPKILYSDYLYNPDAAYFESFVDDSKIIITKKNMCCKLYRICKKNYCQFFKDL